MQNFSKAMKMRCLKLFRFKGLFWFVNCVLNSNENAAVKGKNKTRTLKQCSEHADDLKFM
jgi:hypothetical protein